jgi:hypothetical protein
MFFRFSDSLKSKCSNLFVPEKLSTAPICGVSVQFLLYLPYLWHSDAFKILAEKKAKRGIFMPDLESAIRRKKIVILARQLTI